MCTYYIYKNYIYNGGTADGVRAGHDALPGTQTRGGAAHLHGYAQSVNPEPQP